MPVPRALVTSYTVSVRPFTLLANGTLGTQKRAIWLFATPQNEPRVSNVFLEFHEGPVPVQPGHYVADSEFVRLQLALTQFSDLYAVLQTEAPVEVQMILRDDGTVTRFYLGTEMPEPPGEGVAGDPGV